MADYAHLAKKVLEHAGHGEHAEPDGDEMDGHFASMAQELVDAIHGKDHESVKKILRMCSGM